MRQVSSKVMTAREAISALVSDGDCLALGGFVTNRRAYALAMEIIRQQKKNLYIEGGSSGGDIDMLIGAHCVKAIMVSYLANSGYTMVGRRFREAVEKNTILFEDYSLDVQTLAYHGAALGLSYVPTKYMLGSDLVAKWGISEEERLRHPKLPEKKFIIAEDPFKKGDPLCLVPSPRIDAACIHVQTASPDGTCRIEGLPFHDIDFALASKKTIVSCDQLVSNEEMHRHPERNTLTGLCVDAVVHEPYGAHPSQCFGLYDYDSSFFIEYDKASRTQADFDAFLETHVYSCGSHSEFLDKWGASRLLELRVVEGMGYVPGLKRR
jgi:glutaconate CoA-transferase subunit A